LPAATGQVMAEPVNTLLVRGRINADVLPASPSADGAAGMRHVLDHAGG
jgi:hypothetical protein